MPTINMLSSADRVKGHGVLSAYIEQVDLVKHGLAGYYDVMINKTRLSDIMHYHTIDLKFFLSMPFAKLKGTTVAYVHFIPETIEDSLKLPWVFRKIFYRYIISFYKHMDYLVVVNPYFKAILQKRYKISESKIYYIPNFVSENNFYRYTQEKKKTIRNKMNIQENKFVVLGVGQVQNRKGVLDFIEVAKKFPNIQFLWAGGFSFGPITDGYNKLKKIVDNPPSNVRFLGIIERKKMNDVYNVADMLFLPSYQELFPMAVLEAIAVSLPILLRDCDLYQDILFNYYLKGRNVKDFENIIDRLKDKGQFYRESCYKSQECHKFYSKEHVLKMWKKFYDEITRKREDINKNNKRNIK
ncbi:glycosyltransferase family 4 protein [Clostridium brassicae]|uniref:Glycosyltransferase family 4 protein n=1 Tax=Clostridium brassicae TaxID=2999072 RepID=A0ABT4DAQ1_9CLOT|nr:glycosyltransferase family 4 protein [Clostridium brassicae]MCY6959395.1 glycosyltransferase family 4 protein [Clostridium brassicae]